MRPISVLIIFMTLIISMPSYSDEIRELTIKGRKCKVKGMLGGDQTLVCEPDEQSKLINYEVKSVRIDTDKVTVEGTAANHGEKPFVSSLICVSANDKDGFPVNECCDDSPVFLSSNESRDVKVACTFDKARLYRMPEAISYDVKLHKKSK